VGEIAEQLVIESTNLTFTPHLLPIPRGILSTVYVRLSRRFTAGEVESCFRDFYAGEPWVRVLKAGTLPDIHSALHTNYCALGFGLADDGWRLVVVGCLDNLLKGAAGQAVQNMNVMYGWDEKEGLR
jgi:N-acetyl-gamma-glutamyl-phosphate reductase